MAGYWLNSLFAFLWAKEKLRSIKSLSSHLDLMDLVHLMELVIIDTTHFYITTA